MPWYDKTRRNIKSLSNRTERLNPFSRILEKTKANAIKEIKRAPLRAEGKNGDMRLTDAGDGTASLYIKGMGKWFRVKLDEE